MRKLIISEVLLRSLQEKAAKKVSLDPKRTIIYGKNDTGKSSLIKSIYDAFGAGAAIENPKWKNLRVTILVHFTVDGVPYSILKEGKYHAIFDSAGKIIKSFKSVTTELGPYLAELLNFKVKLPQQNGEIITPPPAFIFLPFYVDQDAGWKDSWTSFKNLTLIKGYREPIVYYHTGIRPNEYYETKGEIAQIISDIGRLEQDRIVSQDILNNIKEKLSGIEFNVDVDIFKEELRELIFECEKLKKKEEKHKEKIVELFNARLVVEAHIELSKEALKETNKDYQYANNIEEHFIHCPTCGADYENSFIERFEIAKDTDRCKELLKELNVEKINIERQIGTENEKLNKSIEEIEKIEVLLQKTKGEIQLRDIIENEGRNEIRKVFDARISELNGKIQTNALKQKDLDKKLKAIGDKERRTKILGEYEFFMAKFLKELEVLSLTNEDYKNIARKIKDTGSSHARSLIAYYFALLIIIQRYSTSVYCPIIIDSPNQQAQDLTHIDKILSFVKQNQPDGSQLILGLEELYSIDFECPIIELNTKYHLLQESEYENVSMELDPYVNQFFENANFLL